jgi:hypothetical protein
MPSELPKVPEVFLNIWTESLINILELHPDPHMIENIRQGQPLSLKKPPGKLSLAIK